MSKRAKSSGFYSEMNDIESLINEKKTSRPIEKNKEVSEMAERSDFISICLLMFLYILQGIPLGLAGSIPMILQQRNVSYKDQATFSLSFWPFSIKLLWAPIVDGCYWRWMGRRKSWMVPSQYFIGIILFALSTTIDSMVGEDGETPRIYILTGAFFFLNFLAATQDIAVDGWALTMLSRRNLGWASTCNSVGQTAGYFLGYVVFLALESREFCQNFLLQKDSLVTLSGFIYFWGIVFIITTTVVWILKSETDSNNGADEEVDLGIIGTYKTLYTLLRKPAVQRMIFILLTVKVGFAAADSMTALKLTEAGVPKDRLALLAIPLTPIQILLPLYISRYTSGPRPLDIFLKAYLPRLFMGIIYAWLVWVTPYFKDSEGHFPNHYYALVVLVYILHQITANCMFVAIMSFYALISDASIGGTYMTLLNTFTNLGGNWPAWVALNFVSELTWKTCMGVSFGYDCNLSDELEACKEDGGVCITTFDGYYAESLFLIVVGIIWFIIGAPILRRLQALPRNSWKIRAD